MVNEAMDIHPPLKAGVDPRGGGGGGGGEVTASAMNSLRIGAVIQRLGLHTQIGDLFNACLHLAKGIDYAVAHNEIPLVVHDLPPVIKQVYQRKNEAALQSAIMLLMVSVKSACRNGWFLVKDTEELLSLTNEISSSFCGTGNFSTEPSNVLDIILTIICRFYPRIKMGQIIVSLEVKPGYEILVVDFLIHKALPVAAKERIRLFVAQTDKMETSSCIISPPEVNFMLNGKGVERRTNVSMDSGPQFPTDVTAMLRYGTNVMQAIGHFNGNYIIVIAYMSLISASDTTVTEDYIQPADTALASDDEIIEGPSRISLNCPISFRRIKTPVKGHLCRHHQLLEEAGEDITDVLISADGSWKLIAEHDDHTNQPQNVALPGHQDGLEQCESTSQDIQTNVVDLTTEETDDRDVGINSTEADTSMGYVNQHYTNTCESEDRKPFQGIHLGFSVTQNLSESPLLRSTSETVQEDACQTGHTILSRILSSASNGSEVPVARMDGHTGISESFTIGALQAPVLRTAVSPVLNQDPMDGCGINQPAVTIETARQARQSATTENMQLQQPQFGNSIVGRETDRRLIPRHVSRAPIAIQALPAQTQGPISHQQRPRTSLLGVNSMICNSTPPVASPASPAVMATPDSFNFLGCDFERQQVTQTQPNPLSTSDVASSSLQPHTMTQNWDSQDLYIPNQSFQQGSSHLATGHQNQASAYRASPGPPPRHQNPQYQHPACMRVSQTISHLENMLRQSSRVPSLHVQQTSQGVDLAAGSATNQRTQLMVPHQSSQIAGPPAVAGSEAPRTISSYPTNANGIRLTMGEHRWNLGGAQPAPMIDSVTELPSEQNWRPTGRMRGSLMGRTYSAALSQLIVQPTPPAQARLL
ncbi:E4 SUMO-protein ligase PIAL2-like isoform X2 [Magnolia sinica]|uniref:E4 SUMO-protein ligase PIAL2-like isoform X2 n=1 Tax=Magnolia sinica TaxID=86752 RepID=UPI002659212C|nr:E4 SUMO-protein ligase PIAL2-like isoform X2 [Magnolia sinica]